MTWKASRKGASTTVRLFFNVPSKVTGFSIGESGTMQDTVGPNYNYSICRTMTLCRDRGDWGHLGLFALMRRLSNGDLPNTEMSCSR